ncbi:MAG: AAA family ATPase [Pyrinomonadaceae bacterium]
MRTQSRLRTQPFSISPDPDLLYLTPALKSTMFKVRHVVDNRQGLTAIMGDVGTGKSSVLRRLWVDYVDRSDEFTTAILPSPNFPSDFAMLKAICADFSIPPKRSMVGQENELRGFLIELDNAGKTCVLFVDEAQRLKGPHLELIRTLLNFETNKYKLIQIVLAAQLELRVKLMDSTKKALRSRIFLPSLLDPLSLPEMREMIAFRCEKAGINNPFTDETTETIYNHTGGVPREVLKVCGFAYILSLQAGERTVPIEAVELAAAEASMHDQLEPEEMA